jgi:hypothetical protein
VFGIGLVLVALQGAVRGWLPMGSNGLRRGAGATRAGQPVLFWLLFLLYLGGGVALTIYAVRPLRG